MRNWLLGTSMLVMAGIPSDIAWASGNEISIEGSALLLGRAGAGRSTDDSAATIAFYNPAGMSALQGMNASTGLSYFDMNGSASMKTNIGGSESGVNYLPHAVAAISAATMALNDKLTVGFAIGPTFGLTVDYQPTFPSAIFTDFTRSVSLALQPVASYRLLPWLSIGVGPSIELSHLETKSQTPFGAINRLYDWNAAAGAVVGLELTPTPMTTIGVVYRSQVDHDFTGSRTGVEPSPSSLTLSQPPLVDLGLRQTVLPGVRVYADATWYGWSIFNQTVFNEPRVGTTILPRNWQDGATFALGADYDLTPIVTVRAGVAYSTNIIPNEDRFPDAPFDQQYRYSVGATYHWSPDMSIDLGYEYADLGHNRVDISAATTGGVSAYGSLQGDGNVVALQVNMAL